MTLLQANDWDVFEYYGAVSVGVLDGLGGPKRYFQMAGLCNEFGVKVPEAIMEVIVYLKLEMAV